MPQPAYHIADSTDIVARPLANKDVSVTFWSPEGDPFLTVVLSPRARRSLSHQTMLAGAHHETTSIEALADEATILGLLQSLEKPWQTVGEHIVTANSAAAANA